MLWQNLLFIHSLCEMLNQFIDWQLVLHKAANYISLTPLSDAVDIKYHLNCGMILQLSENMINELFWERAAFKCWDYCSYNTNNISCKTDLSWAKVPWINWWLYGVLWRLQLLVLWKWNNEWIQHVYMVQNTADLNKNAWMTLQCSAFLFLDHSLLCPQLILDLYTIVLWQEETYEISGCTGL